MQTGVSFRSQLPENRRGAGRMAQVVECLRSKCEALSSHPSAEKRKTQESGDFQMLPSFFPRITLSNFAALFLLICYCTCDGPCHIKSIIWVSLNQSWNVSDSYIRFLAPSMFCGMSRHEETLRQKIHVNPNWLIFCKPTGLSSSKTVSVTDDKGKWRPFQI
jgi:hypothetical protein